MATIRARELSGGVVKKISIVGRPANRTPFRVVKSDVPYWLRPSVVEKKDFSDARRKELAKNGKALPDGSFPIEDKKDLKDAIDDVGRAKDSAKAKAHIKSRAKDLGAEGMLPDDWKSGGKKAEASMSIFDRLGGLGGLGRTLFKKDTPEPVSAVSAIVVSKADDTDETRIRIKRAFKADVNLTRGVSEDGDTVVYKLDSYKPGEQDLVIKTGNLGVVVSNVKKGLFDSDTTPYTFADRMVDNCILPGLSQAMDTMSGALWCGVTQAADSAAAVAKIDEVMNEATAYLKTLVGAIPIEAFKAEAGGKLTLDLGDYNTVVRFPMDRTGSSNDPNNGATNMGADGGSKGVDPDEGGDVTGESGLDRVPARPSVKKFAADGGKDVATVDDAPDNLKGAARQSWANMKNKKKGIGGTKDGYTTADNGDRKSTDGVIDDEDGKGGGNRATGSGTGVPVKKADNAEVLAAITALGESVKKMSGEIGEVKKTVADVAGKVAKNEDGLKRVSAVLKSTVNVEAEGDVVAKGDEDNSVYNGSGAGMGLIDTGISREFLKDSA